jgi:hypothetical protein
MKITCFLDFLKNIPLVAVLRERLAGAEKEITSLKTENAELKKVISLKGQEIQNVQQQIQELEKKCNDNIVFRYGIFWDKEGNYYCPNCRKPTLQIAWATHLNQQFLGMKCPCTPKSFVLSENGQPIHAEDVIKMMKNSIQVEGR